MTEPIALQFEVDAEESGSRLDALIASKITQCSRTVIRKAITAGEVTVDDRRAKPSYKLRGGEKVSANILPTVAAGPEPEPIDLDIVFEDECMAVINKPTGMVVHPAKGHWAGTLTSALAHHFTQLSAVGGPQRPGIVHRLDRDTSGLIAVAKTDQAHVALAKQFEMREVEKEYYALCRGSLDRDRDWVRQPIGVHPYQREKMAVRADHETSRSAETFYEVVDRWKGYVSVRVFPKTGRTHQIRVHMAYVGCPVLCDPLYSGHRRLTAADLSEKRSASDQEILLDRLALHARRLKIRHPVSDEMLEFEAPIPQPLIDVTNYFQKI